MSWKFPKELREQLLENVRNLTEQDPELKEVCFSPEEFTEAFVRMAECGEWPGSKAKDPKLVVKQFRQYCERTIVRELRGIVATRGRRI